MSISLYDVLDVAPDASSEEIRAAWRAAVADLDPTDRRFTVYNEAGRTLLDPEARAAYDREREREVDTEPAAPAAPVPSRAPEAAPQAGPEQGSDRGVEQDPGKAPRTRGRSLAARLAGPGRARTGAGSRPVPLWIPAVLAVVLAALVVGVVLQARVPSDDAVAEATRDAQVTAERAMTAILSYDFETFDDGVQRAESFLTEQYRDEKYDDIVRAISPSVQETEAVVDAEVIGSAVSRVDVTDLDRIQVLVVVNQSETNKSQSQPSINPAHARVTLEHVGDRWLVDQICTTASCES